jgi:hypothetical protein
MRYRLRSRGVNACHTESVNIREIDQAASAATVRFEGRDPAHIALALKLRCR